MSKEKSEKTMQIYVILGILATVLPLTTTKNNKIAGFAVAGISPLNPVIFRDSEYLPSYETDRPQATPNGSQGDSSLLFKLDMNLFLLNFRSIT
ncbi:hypothetical protein AVEN_35817-1 [Araneus ventricosus]|uniref:Uncharacterized protein n=1 Tax=Araneus ventricosus TaxID=182803 RepID=A0A4Y2BJ18_ARAVE|nr:hypothetical protein AVEN_35817-1 [Araneus ventricosus]